MKCPKCKNKGFRPTEELKHPLLNMGNKEKYDTFDTRRYVCLQCGYKFMTSEEYYREIDSGQASLFENLTSTKELPGQLSILDEECKIRGNR
jgi:rubredoxin